MPFVLLPLRALLLFLAFGAPVGVLGLALGGATGFLIAEALSLLSLLGFALRAESGVLRAYQVRETTPEGVRQSLARALATMGGAQKGKGHPPQIRIFDHPSALALVVRSPGSPGTIILSAGLLGLLNESELRDLMGACVKRLRSRGVVFQSLCAWLAHGVLRLAPHAWREMWFGELRRSETLSPLGALRFVSIYSVARFFSRLGQQPQASQSVDALRVYVAHSRWASDLSNPGTGILHLVDPWARRSLLPLC